MSKAVTVKKLQEAAVVLDVDVSKRDTKSVLVSKIIDHLQGHSKKSTEPKRSAKKPSSAKKINSGRVSTQVGLVFDTLLKDDFKKDGNNSIKTLSEQWAALLKSKPDLAKVDAIVVKTKYTDRIYNAIPGEWGMEKADIRKRLALLKPAVVYTDKAWNRDLQPHVKSATVKDVVEGCGKDMDGTIVFDETRASALIDVYKRLKEADYCALYPLIKVEWYVPPNDPSKLVLWAYVDSESG